MKNKRINGSWMSVIRDLKADTSKYDYVMFDFMPIRVCIFEDMGMAFGQMFEAHEICNFNTCVSIQRLAFISPSSVDLVERRNYDHESSLWEGAMLEWLDKFSTKFELGSEFEYLYFFNLHGDATLYLDLNEQQLSKIQAYFIEEYDAERISHLWSFESVNGNFSHHLYSLVENTNKDEYCRSIALYSLRSRDEIEHRRSCAFSMLPLRLDIMNHFLQQNQFVKPHTRVSFEYKLEEGSYPGELKYGAWADFSCHALEFFCLMFDIEQLRVFTLTYRKSNSIFVDFYFENDLDTQLSRQLISNFAKGNFGVRLVPDGILNSELEYVVCHGINELSSEEFVNSLPQENVSFYGLFDLKKRLALRHYSYASGGKTLKGQFFMAFNNFRVFFCHDVLDSIADEIVNTDSWFKPSLFEAAKLGFKRASGSDLPAKQY